MARLLHYLRQFYPPKPAFTDADVPSLAGKTFIVTGSNTGVGKEVARILYAKHASVYVAARSPDKSQAAIDEIRASAPDSTGSLKFLRLDLADLAAVKTAAAEFLAAESRLHGLINNAGVMLTRDDGSRTAQGHELHLGTNCIGPFLLTRLLTPVLTETAQSEPPGAVRVVWASSMAAELASRRPGGVDLDDLQLAGAPLTARYAASKAGNYLHAAELARRLAAAGVASVPLNPGNLDSDLYRGRWAVTRFFMRHAVLYPSVYGAYTELFAALSPDVTMERSGEWVAPWGRFVPLRKDLVDASKPEAEGGTGLGHKYWEWTEEQVKPYL